MKKKNNQKRPARRSTPMRTTSFESLKDEYVPRKWRLSRARIKEVQVLLDVCIAKLAGY